MDITNNIVLSNKEITNFHGAFHRIKHPVFSILSVITLNLIIYHETMHI